ncbi:MAG: right-handed parallel beta-helix repeat-containing protein [Ignavibacteriales bacterium]|nr:right-handed parallel beta-helix repeat-containing protein [Ignavibacteriales bacterium]
MLISTVNIKNVKFLGIFTQAIRVLNTSGSIQNCYFYASSIAINGPEWTNSPPMLISKNLFYRVNHGIYAEYSTIIDNSFIDTFVEAVHFHPWFGKFTDVRNNFIHGRTYDVGINQVPNTIENNIIINFARGIVMQPGTRVTNNIILNSRECAIYTTSSLDTAVINYNCFYNNTAISNNTALFNPDTTIYYASDPMFENQDSNNYLLQMFSLLINAGDPNILDVDGSRSDVGLYGGPYGQSYVYKDLPPKKPKFTLVKNKMEKLISIGKEEPKLTSILFHFTEAETLSLSQTTTTKYIPELIHYSQIRFKTRQEVTVIN